MKRSCAATAFPSVVKREATGGMSIHSREGKSLFYALPGASARNAAKYRATVRDSPGTLAFLVNTRLSVPAQYERLFGRASREVCRDAWLPPLDHELEVEW